MKKIKEEYELIELPGLNENRQKEYCLVCSTPTAKKVCLLTYPKKPREMRHYKLYRKINWN